MVIYDALALMWHPDNEKEAPHIRPSGMSKGVCINTLMPR